MFGKLIREPFNGRFNDFISEFNSRFNNRPGLIVTLDSRVSRCTEKDWRLQPFNGQTLNYIII